MQLTTISARHIASKQALSADVHSLAFAVMVAFGNALASVVFKADTFAIPAELIPEPSNNAGKGKAKPVPKKRRLKEE